MNVLLLNLSGKMLSPLRRLLTSFVLLEYSDVEAQKILLNRLRKDRLLLNKISATNAYKELDDAVNAAQEKEVAENNVIMEVLSE